MPSGVVMPSGPVMPSGRLVIDLTSRVSFWIHAYHALIMQYMYMYVGHPNMTLFESHLGMLAALSRRSIDIGLSCNWL